jgi:hypothetical protein
MDFAATAALTDPADLERVKAEIVAVESADSAEPVLEVYGVRTLPELCALDAARLYARHLAASAEESEWSAERRAAISLRRLGELQRGDTAFVVFESAVTEEGETDRAVAAVWMSRTPGGWRARLTGDDQLAGVGQVQDVVDEVADTSAGPSWTEGAAAGGDAPERVAERYLRAFAAYDWPAVAAMADPAELDSMKRAVLREAAGDEGQETLLDVGVGSLAELRALPASTIYQRYLSNVVPHTAEGETAPPPPVRIRVFGQVPAGDLAYEVYRAADPRGTLTGVQELRRYAGAWHPYLLN